MIAIYSAKVLDESIGLLNPISRVLASHRYVLGDEVEHFEIEFARYVGTSHCVSVANGTDALELALRGSCVSSGDRVLTVANAGFYGSTAIHAIGAIPIYVDVDDAMLTMSPSALSVGLEAKPKAVIVTHLYGQLADMESIVGICEDAGVPLIEDCAQAHGARRNGKGAGSFGTVGCFSFYPTKNLGAIGDGGAVTTDNAEVADRIRHLRQYGWSQKYRVQLSGGRNSRLDEIQAAVLREKLTRLDEMNVLRRDVARRYQSAFADLSMRIPRVVGEDNACHLYVARVANRERLQRHLREREIGSDFHYPIADHLQPAYACQQAQGSLPVTEAACASCISLPCYPGLRDDEVDSVIAAVHRFFQRA